MIILAALSSACSSSHASPGVAGTAPPTHFSGVPPVGANYSEPENDGRIVIQISPASRPGQTIYADGRVITARDTPVNPKGAPPFHTAWVQQWLKPQGIRRLRSRILAIGRPVGLFASHNVGLLRKAYRRHGLDAPEDEYDVRVEGRLINVGVFSSSYRSDPSYRNDPEATPAQVRALARINTLVPRLPASVWKDRTFRPYIPSHFCVAWDRAAPDPAKVPSPAKQLLTQLLAAWSKTASGTLTTDQARVLYAGFARARLRFSDGSWYVPTATDYPRYTQLRFEQRLPDNNC